MTTGYLDRGLREYLLYKGVATGEEVIKKNNYL